MPDADSAAMASDLGSLCASCSQIFAGRYEIDISEDRILMESPAIGLLEPQFCRICAVIWTRHKQSTEEHYRLGQKLDLLGIGYRLFKLHGTDKTQKLQLALHLHLEYTEDLHQYIQFTVIPEDSAKHMEFPQSLSSRTDSKSSIDFLLSKFRSCCESHLTCSQRSNLTPGWHPKRILEIEGADPQIISLRNREEFFFKPYVTLSHCWGNLKPLQLTAESEASLRAGVSTELLPKTFRDAIDITNELSISYIWIDSLCIFQDDLRDWHEEAAAMCDVYSNALCNLAATGAYNGSVGMFFERDPTAGCPFWVNADWDISRMDNGNKVSYDAGRYMVLISDQWQKDLEQGPLNRRAWVMQERFLSTRVMHFSTSQVFWECLENTSSEYFPESIPREAEPVWHSDSQQLKRVFYGLSKDDEWENETYRLWQIFVRAYSSCELSKESDKLVAIHGVQQLLSKVMGTKFIWGMWQNRLIQDLCWLRHLPLHRKDLPFHPQKWRAPTWSWAGSNVQMHPGSMRHHITCPNLQEKVTIEAINIDESDVGQLKHASLQLRGKLLHATLVLRDLPSNSGHKYEVLFRGSNASGLSTLCNSLSLDNPDTPLHDGRDVVCLGMYSCNCELSNNINTGPRRSLEALVLRLVDLGQNRYERIGMVEISESSYDSYIAYETDIEHSLVIT